MTTHVALQPADRPDGRIVVRLICVETGHIVRAYEGAPIHFETVQQAIEACSIGELQIRQAVQSAGLYWSVIVPAVSREFKTAWHPDEGGEPLSRGAFKTEAEAIRWAREHLNGAPYRLAQYESGAS